jgi:Ca-activated chloride channel family protein
MIIPGTEIRLLHPHFLWLLPALVAVALWQARRGRARAGAVRFSDLKHVRAIGPTLALRLRPILRVMRLLALGFFIVAMARPQRGWRERHIKTYGVDIVLALDVSGSMQATDFDPNRLEAAKAVIGRFLDQRQFDRVGVVVFGDTAFTLCPLTLDYGVVREFVERLTFERLGEQQTALGLGLATAVDRLKDSDAKSRVIVLLTDGKDTVGGVSPREGAEVAKALGTRVYAIGVGSEGMSLQSRQGLFGMMFQPQRAEFDEKTLRDIADRTGGKYYHATDEKNLREIYEEIDRLERSEAEYNDYDHYDERMAYVLMPGLVWLLLELLLANTWFLKLP